jgi:hypothetical protein
MFRLQSRPALPKTTAALVLGLTVLVIPAGSVHAGWVASVGQLFANVDEWRLDQTPANFTGPRPGREFTMLAVRNNTDSPIYFAASWVPYMNPFDNSSHLSSTNGTPFIHQAWIMVPPGQVHHVGNTTNGVFYLFAVQPDRGRVWHGEHLFHFPNSDVPLACRRYEFVFMPPEYTVDFNP